jgi:hypothetical protein
MECELVADLFQWLLCATNRTIHPNGALPAFLPFSPFLFDIAVIDSDATTRDSPVLWPCSRGQPLELAIDVPCRRLQPGATFLKQQQQQIYLVSSHHTSSQGCLRGGGRDTGACSPRRRKDMAVYSSTSASRLLRWQGVSVMALRVPLTVAVGDVSLGRSS